MLMKVAEISQSGIFKKVKVKPSLSGIIKKKRLGGFKPKLKRDRHGMILF